MKSSELIEALRLRYAPPEWAFLEQVANSTGHDANRWCDALAISLWPSRGIQAFGFEAKVFRSDWKRELENPAKADVIACRCDRWYVVVPAESKILREGELPAAWGLIEVTKKSAKVVKEATQLEAKKWGRNFVAAILRRAAEAHVATLQKHIATHVAPGEVEAEITKRLERERSNWEAHAQGELVYLRSDHAALKQRCAAFEKATGIKISDWLALDDLETMRMFAAGKRAKIKINGALRAAEDAVRSLQEASGHAVVEEVPQ